MNRPFVLAVPSEHPGGLDAPRSGHFGQAPCFTLLTVEDGGITAVTTLDNGAHATQGCLGPVRALAEAGVGAVVVGGLGARPLDGLMRAGITVYQDGSGATVAQAAAACLAGTVQVFDPAATCRGGCH